MFSLKISILLCLELSFYSSVLSHESLNHDHYSFKELQDAVNGDSLTPEDLQRLFNKLHFLNCSDNKSGPDYRKVRWTVWEWNHKKELFNEDPCRNFTVTKISLPQQETFVKLCTQTFRAAFCESSTCSVQKDIFLKTINEGRESETHEPEEY